MMKQSVLDQLVELYEDEPWHSTRISPSQAMQYYSRMLAEDRIITCIDGEGTVLGYVEYCRVNLGMLGYLVVANEITPDFHDPNGTIIYVSGLYIIQNYRQFGIIQYLKKELLRKNPDADYLTGETQGKHRKHWAVYRLRKA